MREIPPSRLAAKLRTLLVIGTLSVVAGSAQAQLLDQLKGAAGMGQGGSGAGALGGLPSVGQASSGNLTGVLTYCIKNKYLGGGSGASSVKDSLMSKVTGNNPGYKDGSNGLLQTGNGQNFSLGGGGIKEQITQKVCEQVLARGKSLL